MSNVTHLHCKPDIPGEIGAPGNQRLLRHWAALRGARPMPDKQELDLRAIARELPWLGIAGRGSGGHFVWRLAGSALCEMWNHELGGEEVFHGWPSFERASLARLLARVAENHLPGVARLNLKRGAYLSSLPAELLALPLRDAESGETVILLSIMPPAGEDNPALIDISDVEMTFMRVIWPQAANPRPASAPAAAHEAPGEGARRGPFRVITGGRARQG